MVKLVLQHTVDMPSPRRHIKQSFAIESAHSAGIPDYVGLFLGLLLAVV